MARVLIVTVPYEGGYYSPRKDYSAPIRIFSDRWVEDDIYRSHCGQVKRNRLSKNEYRHVRRAAKRNVQEGRV